MVAKRKRSAMMANAGGIEPSDERRAQRSVFADGANGALMVAKRKRSAMMANAGGIEPSDERRQHGRVARAVNADGSIERVIDSDGQPGIPYRGETLLSRLERHGDITPAMRAAGERFHALFQRAGHSPLQAADMARTPSASGYSHDSHYAEFARRQVHKAMAALGGIGSPIGSAAWHVIGNDCSIREWALREAWNGRPLDERVAKGLVVGALGVLELHFGY